MSVSISAYCYCNRAEQYDMPYVGSILSWADVCKNGRIIVVTDPRFKDGTLEKLQQLEKSRSNITVHEHEWNVDNPGCDGLEKAYARNLAADTGADVLIPFDVDEVVHEKSVPVLLQTAEVMVQRKVRVIATGIFDWFNGKHIRFNAPLYKPRLTLNDGLLTHGIPEEHKLVLPNGKVYASKLTDGAGLIDTRSRTYCGENLSLSEPLSINTDPNESTEETIKAGLSRLAKSLVNRNHVWLQHFSWLDLPRKWAMDQTWWYLWHNLYGDYPNGLEDYKVFKTNEDGKGGESVNFWEISDVRRPLDSYRDAIIDQMSRFEILSLTWLSFPKYVNYWIKSHNRRVWGQKRADIKKPNTMVEKGKESIERIFRRRFDF